MSLSIVEDTSPRSAVMRAYLLLDAGELEGARRALSHAASLATDEPMIFALQGAVSIAAGQLDEALKTLRATTRRFPAHPAAHTYFAEASLLLRRVGQAKRALAAARAALEEPTPPLSEAERVAWETQIACLEQLLEQLDPALIPAPIVTEGE